jgi:hypothetical protein
MEHTLKDHIARLEARIRELSEESMTDNLNYVERNRIESEIRAAEMALSYYRRAYDLERQVFPYNT